MARADGYSPLPGSTGLTPEELKQWKPPRKALTDKCKALAATTNIAIARFTSSGWALFLRVAFPALNYALDPFLKLKIIAGFLWPSFRDPLWATACFASNVMPFLAIYLLYNYIGHGKQLAERKEQFVKAFGGNPTMLMILRMHFFVICAGLRRALGSAATFTLEAQCYAKVELLMTGSIGNTTWVIFQIYIFFRQPYLKRHVVEPQTLCISVASSFLNQYLAFSYLKDYAKITHEGNYVSFFSNLLTLGNGMAAPAELAKLRTEKHIVLQADFSRLDHRGLNSVSRSISSSVTAVTVRFQNTGIEDLLTRSADCLRFFADELSFNRHILKKVTFDSHIEHEQETFGYALRLNEVVHGGAVMFKKEVASDAVKLMDAIEGGDTTLAIDEAKKFLEDIDGEFLNACRWSARLGCWQSLAGMLALTTPQQMGDGFVNSLLYNAAGEGEVACIQLLLACGAKPTDSGAGYCGPLSMAVCCGHRAAAAVLLDARADPKERDNQQMTPLHQAMFIDQPDTVKTLLNAKADVEAMGDGGRQPLMGSAQEGSVGNMREMIKQRADPNTADSAGETALAKALRTGQVESVKFLVKAGATITADMIENWAQSDDLKEKFMPLVAAQ